MSLGVATLSLGMVTSPSGVGGVVIILYAVAYISSRRIGLLFLLAPLLELIILVEAAMVNSFFK